jgi:putative serine protease PepD
VAEQLIANGVAQHPQLGVTARDVEQTGQQGAVVASVVPDTGAARAGLREGDLITAVDGQPVTSTESLVALVRAGRVGEPMTLTVIRNGSEESVTVTPTAAAR